MGSVVPKSVCLSVGLSSVSGYKGDWICSANAISAAAGDYCLKWKGEKGVKSEKSLRRGVCVTEI